MQKLNNQTKKERISFFVNKEFADKVNKIAKQNNQSVSELARTAIQNYIEQLEKEKIAKELEVGYQANYDYYLNSQEEWKHSDNE